MKLAICTEAKGEAAHLRTLLEQVSRELCLTLETEEFKSCTDLLRDHRPGRFGVVLLDGDLPDCVEAGRQLRRTDRECGVVLFAEDSRMALLGYALHPDGFAEKPVTYRALQQALERCRQNWRQEARFLQVLSNRVEVRVICADISWVEVSGRTLTIRGRYGHLHTRVPMAQVEEQLHEAPFLKCHRSCLVNLFRVRVCQREFLEMEDGTRIPISEDRWGEVQEGWQQFCRDNPVFACEIGEGQPDS